jgi:iron complex transport system permease protein
MMREGAGAQAAPFAELDCEQPRARRRAPWFLPLLAVGLVVTLVLSLAVGSVTIPWGDLLGIASRKLGIGSGTHADESGATVLVAIRLPRVVLGVLIGSALGLSGASMQGVFRNPLVDPGLLGVSSGAALGAAATIVLGAKVARGLPPGFASYVLPVAAFGAAFAAMALVERIARVSGRSVIATLLLAGIAVNALAFAQTGLLTFLATDAQLRTLTFWTLGSLGGATWTTVGSAALFTVAPIFLLARFGQRLNALLLGEAEAMHLGVDVERTKRLVMLLVTLLVGASVAIAGVLGFVGLVVPHVVRLVVGPDHRRLLPGAALLGGALLPLADTLARTIVSPAELPLGIVTASIGAPFFLALLVKERRRLA